MAIEVIDEIKQFNNGEFAIVHCNNVRGGIHIVDDENSRDLIPLMRRNDGMICYTTITKKWYQLNDQNLDNTGWVTYNPIQDITDEMLLNVSSLTNKITSLESRISELEDIVDELSTLRAICGTFAAGELKANQGNPVEEISSIETPTAKSSLSNNFRKKLLSNIALKVGD